ncbi:15530_t:CDS:2 [Acaulospora colombiana]|uniref:15530_t:CDS:1 n=1 Tax=Acaulospora colombiana TaxID=27376 RepID=A0ACA9KY40_9GLOM|nr:15530_t:CDS:2 [Acaulospora colombiana]
MSSSEEKSPVDTEAQHTPDSDNGSTGTTVPPQSIPPSFVFRTNTRNNIYINPITNLTSIPSPIENNDKVEECPKWDEKKAIEGEERTLQRKHQLNVAQVLYGKDIEQEVVEKFKGPRNFLDGYYIYYLNGLEECQKHTEAKRIIKRAFTPGFQLGKKYIESWSDGTQVEFFKRFYESAQRLDAVHMVRDNVRKIIEIWGKGGGGGGSNNNNSANERGNDTDKKN